MANSSVGVAAILFPKGRTIHSRFKVPLNITSDSTCDIKPQRDTAIVNLIRDAKVIIWDEATCQNKYILHAVNRTLQDIMKNKLPFGGKCIGK